MADETPNTVAGINIARVLQCASDLVREHSRWKINAILELEDAVYACWLFQIDIRTEPYLDHQLHLDAIEVTAEDVLISSRLPPRFQISPMAILSRNSRNRYGPGRLLPRSPRRQPSTEYSFDWTSNSGAHSVLVGDLAKGVLTWQLNNRGIDYEQRTRTVPDPESWRLWRAIERWEESCDALMPTEISLHPGAALEYVRNLPEFTEALEALIAFDSHRPSAVLQEQGKWTIENAHEHVDAGPEIQPDLSALPLTAHPSKQARPDPDSEAAGEQENRPTTLEQATEP